MIRGTVERSEHSKIIIINNAYNVDWDDATLYHLIVNTGEMDIELATKVILALYSR